LFEEQIVLEKQARESHIEAHTEGFAEAASFLPTVDDFDKSCDEYLRLIQEAKQAVEYSRHRLSQRNYAWRMDCACQVLEQAGADALELNYYDLPSDPDETGYDVERRALELVRAVRDEVEIPLAVKLSPFFSSLPNFAKRLVADGADGLVIFNRFYQPDIDIEELDVKPVLELSTPSELRLRLRWLAILSSRLDTSFAATGGVHWATDAIRAIMAGATVVQMVSCLLRFGPEHLKVVIAEFTDWLETHEYESVSQLRGAMNCEFARSHGLRAGQLPAHSARLERVSRKSIACTKYQSCRARLQLAEEHARKAAARRSPASACASGLVSGVVPEALEFAFDVLKERHHGQRRFAGN
jgi:dihydroorotate dehydrogenase (fumarate)